MLFPKPAGFKFYKDAFRYISVMAGVAGIGFIASFVNFVRLEVGSKAIYGQQKNSHNIARMASYNCSGPRSDHYRRSSSITGDVEHWDKLRIVATQEERDFLHQSPTVSAPSK